MEHPGRFRGRPWTFLTSHGHVRLAVAQPHDARVAEIAAEVGQHSPGEHRVPGTSAGPDDRPSAHQAPGDSVEIDPGRARRAHGPWPGVVAVDRFSGAGCRYLDDAVDVPRGSSLSIAHMAGYRPVPMRAGEQEGFLSVRGVCSACGHLALEVTRPTQRSKEPDTLMLDTPKPGTPRTGNRLSRSMLTA